MDAQSLCKLDMYYRIDTSPDQAWAPMPETVNDKLDFLEFDILWLDDQGGNPNVWRCQDVILKAPKLRSLSIRMNYGLQNSSTPVAACPTRAFKFAPSEVLPAIERLSLKHLPVGICEQRGLEHKIDIVALRHLVVENGALGNLETFLGNLMARGQICLTKLILIEDLLPTSAHSSSWPTVLDKFLWSFVGLRELALLGSAAVALHLVEGAIHSHSKTLRSLKIHDASEVGRLEYYPLKGAQFSHLKRMSTALPLLEALEMDLPLGCVSPCCRHLLW